MKTRIFLLLFLLALAAGWQRAAAQGTAFTYQGRVNDGGSPANGFYDMTFTIFPTNQTGAAVAPSITNLATVVSNGLFTVTLDFGNVFIGTTNWLEIAVRTNGPGAFGTLTPRQQITPPPQAIYAITAGNATTATSANSVVAANILGVLSSSQLPSFQSSGNYDAIGGGQNNTNNGASGGTIGGGTNNTITGGTAATIAGGGGNLASANLSFIGGGQNNDVSAAYAMVGGGKQNTNSASYGVVGGGFGNLASDVITTVGGGENNHSTVNGAFVGGGFGNLASASDAAVGGGNGNIASGNGSFVGGGGYNGTTDQGNIASGAASVIDGGYGNTNTGSYATVAGGYQNLAGGNYSFAAGENARAVNNNTFVWSDGSAATVSAAINSVTMRATNGFRFFTGTNGSIVFTNVYGSGSGQQVSWTPGAGSWSFTSDRTTKDRFEPVDAGAVLDKVAQLPISEWSYQGYGQRHIGAMAQDFHSLFPLNDNDKVLNDADLHGVELAAIQGLNQEVREKEARLEQQDAQIADFKLRLERLERIILNQGTDGSH